MALAQPTPALTENCIDGSSRDGSANMLVYSNRPADKKSYPTRLNRIGRYIFRETLASTTIVMAVLLLIFMSSQFADTLGDAAADLLPREAVFQVIGLQFLQTLALIAPIGLLLGVLLALARLNRDSEMAALSACGIGPFGLLRPIGLLSVLVASGIGWLALQEGPAASRKIEEISFRAQEQLEFEALQPGQFTSIDAGSTIFYAREAEGSILRGVFVLRDFVDRIEIGSAVERDADGGVRLVLHAGLAPTVTTPGWHLEPVEEPVEPAEGGRFPGLGPSGG